MAAALDQLCKTAKAWHNIHFLCRWNLCIETDILPLNLHHFCFIRINHTSTDISKVIFPSAENRCIFLHIIGFAGEQVNSLPL